MSWNEKMRRNIQALNERQIKQYGAWIPWDKYEEFATLRDVLNHMLLSLPDEALDTKMSLTDMTFVSKPPCVVPADTPTYDDPLGTNRETRYNGFTAWKVWYVGENNGKKPMEESPQRTADEVGLRDEDRDVSGQQES